MASSPCPDALRPLPGKPFLSGMYPDSLTGAPNCAGKGPGPLGSTGRLVEGHLTFRTRQRGPGSDCSPQCKGRQRSLMPRDHGPQAANGRYATVRWKG
jgi:hypothetical protein